MLWFLTLSLLAAWSVSCFRNFHPKWYKHIKYDLQHYQLIQWLSLIYIFFIQQYPDYYAIIKEPIDLKIIAQKIQVCFYTFYDKSAILFINFINWLYFNKILSTKCPWDIFAFSWVTTGVSVPWLKTLICWSRMPKPTMNLGHKCSRSVSVCEHKTRCPTLAVFEIHIMAISCVPGCKHH